MANFLLSFLFSILTIVSIFLGPMIIYHANSLDCNDKNNEYKKIYQLIGSLFLVFSTILFTGLIYNVNIFSDFFLYFFVISGVLILNYAITTTCNDQVCDKNKKILIISGSVITVLSLFFITYYINKRNFTY